MRILGDPRGIDWVYKADKFYIQIDPWFEVTLNRKDLTCDGIALHVDIVDELKEAMEFIQPEE